MSESSEGQLPEQEPDKKAEKSYRLVLRGPVFNFLADRLAPIYVDELSRLTEDGAYAPLLDYHDSPFANVAERILKQAEEFPKVPEVVVCEMTQPEFEAILDKLPEERNFIRSKISSELKEEFKSSFRDAKFTAKLKNAAKTVTQKIRRKKS